MVTEERRGYRIDIDTTAPESSPDELPANATSRASESMADEVLRIDGDIVPYLKTPEGFRVYYQPPQNDLLEAARSYVDTQPEKKE